MESHTVKYECLLSLFIIIDVLQMEDDSLCYSLLSTACFIKQPIKNLKSFEIKEHKTASELCSDLLPASWFLHVEISIVSHYLFWKFKVVVVFWLLR